MVVSTEIVKLTAFIIRNPFAVDELVVEEK